MQDKLATDAEVLNEMSNLYFRTTGINARICISSKGLQPIPRIKIYNNDNSEYISFSIEDKTQILEGDPIIISPIILKQAMEWILLNKGLLLFYWEHPEMDAVELLERVQKVK